jgi:putative Holliday junction resolvase
MVYPIVVYGDPVLKKKVQGVKIDWQDEQFTSKMAVEAMVAGGMKKKDRRKKENIDKISAAIILQSYLEER